MPTKPKPRITAWSHSRKSDYDKCPFAAKCKHIDRVKEPSNYAMSRGKKVHDEAEKYGKGEIRKRPESLDNFKEEFAMVRRIRKRCEFELAIAVNKNWQQTEWMAHDVYLRLKVDLLWAEKNGTVLEIVDHKTGKVRVENEEQLKLYPAGLLNIYPDVQTFNASFWYLDAGEISNLTFTRDEALDLQKHFDKSVKKMLSDRTFKKNPGYHCKWCYYRAEEKGLCQHG